MWFTFSHLVQHVVMNDYESVLRWWARLRGVALKWVWLLWQIRAPSCSCGFRELPVEVAGALGSPSQWLCTPRVQWSQKVGLFSCCFFSFLFCAARRSSGLLCQWVMLAIPVAPSEDPCPVISKNFWCFVALTTKPKSICFWLKNVTEFWGVPPSLRTKITMRKNKMQDHS